MTPRVHETLHARWVAAGRPMEGWVFPGDTEEGFVEYAKIDSQHDRILRRMKLVVPFRLYDFRLTALNSDWAIWSRCVGDPADRRAHRHTNNISLRAPNAKAHRGCVRPVGGVQHPEGEQGAVRMLRVVAKSGAAKRTCLYARP
jgi:hypothetical protein